MKKFLISFLLIFVLLFSVHSQEGIKTFYSANFVGGSTQENDVYMMAVFSNIRESGFLQNESDLNQAEIELIINCTFAEVFGFNQAGYIYSVALVHHNPAFRNFSDVATITSGRNVADLYQAADYTLQFVREGLEKAFRFLEDNRENDI